MFICFKLVVTRGNIHVTFVTLPAESPSIFPDLSRSKEAFVVLMSSVKREKSDAELFSRRPVNFWVVVLFDYKNEEVAKMRKLIETKKKRRIQCSRWHGDQTKTAPQPFTKSEIAWMKLKAKYFVLDKYFKGVSNIKSSPVIQRWRHDYPPWKASFWSADNYISVKV